MRTTFAELADLEPRLRELDEAVYRMVRRRPWLAVSETSGRRKHRDRHGWAVWEWYRDGGLKAALSELAGWGAKPAGFDPEPGRHETAAEGRARATGGLAFMTTQEITEDGDDYDRQLEAHPAGCTADERAKFDRLKTSHAYDVAYDHLLTLLIGNDSWVR